MKKATWIRNVPDEEKVKEFQKLGWAKGLSTKSVYWTCSSCGGWGTPYYNYCQSCGAKMGKADVVNVDELDW